jgi:hypothetical protein
MAMTKAQIDACKSCVSSNQGKPPCVSANRLAAQRKVPVFRFVDSVFVKWPCYFHADWAEIFPILVKPKFGAPGLHASDLNAIPYPDNLSPYKFKALREAAVEGDGRYTVGRGTSQPSEERTQQTAVHARYVSNGTSVLLDGRYAILFAKHYGDRFASWVDGLNAGAAGGLFNGDVSQQWAFETYGGGGAFDFAGGDVIVDHNQTDGRGNAVLKGGAPVTTSHFKITYLAYGPGFSTKGLPKIKASHKVAPWAAASPNRFTTLGVVMKNFDVFGTSEPEPRHFSGFCIIFNVTLSVAAGWGFAAANVGAGGDLSCMMIFGGDNYSIKPTILLMMAGKTSGLAAGIGFYFGYASVGSPKAGPYAD